MASLLAAALIWAMPMPTLAEQADETALPDQAQAEPALEPTAQPEVAPVGLYGVDMFAYRLLKQGDKGDEVRELQQRLAELGYFTASVTGNFGSVTREAVMAFQRRCGLEVDGMAGQLTYERLFSDDAPMASTASQPTQAPTQPAPTQAPADSNQGNQSDSVSSGGTPDFEGILSSGSRGDAVKRAQQRLKALGYLAGSADGIFGSGTAAAVRAFQIRCGISVDGAINFETHIRLYSDDAPAANVSATPIPTAAPTPDATPTAAPATPSPAPATPAPTQAPSAAYPGLLKYGSRGDAVKALQSRLVELGYLTGSVDGVFGNDTRNAVKAFQGAKGMSVTGEVDEKTHNALYSNSQGDRPDGDAFTELSKGMSGDAVRTLQQRLKELGYFNGSLLGNFGELTEAALMDFQQAAGLTRSGVLDRATYDILYSADAPYKDYDESDYTELRPGDQGADVKRLQQRLKELGYLTGSVDGAYGAATAAAVSAFQQQAGLSVTGVADVVTQQQLFMDGALTPGASPTPEATPAPTPVATAYPTLKNGSVGAQVKALQQRLIELGYLNDKADGAYGAKTATAVKSFQIKLGLSATGIADSQTQIELYRADAPSKDSSAQVTPLPTATPAASATPDPNATPDPSATPTAYRTLKVGSTGEDVRLLKQRLSELGYYEGTIDDTYDTATQDAVKSFQKANSLSVDGAAGVQTQTRLYSSDAISKEEAGDSADVESNYPTQVSGTPQKPVIGEIIEMDWFENVDGFFNRSSGTFRAGATALVTDVKTGITYTVRRIGGSNHADVEPLTAFDAWQMYRIYNKNWSWTRRAVVVTIGGKNIAASINGMPHGGESITNNNFVGHSCIHFTNSRTHGTNRVDPDHQAAVQTALNTSVSALNSRIQAQ